MKSSRQSIDLINHSLHFTQPDQYNSRCSPSKSMHNGPAKTQPAKQSIGNFNEIVCLNWKQLHSHLDLKLVDGHVRTGSQPRAIQCWKSAKSHLVQEVSQGPFSTGSQTRATVLEVSCRPFQHWKSARAIYCKVVKESHFACIFSNTITHK